MHSAHRQIYMQGIILPYMDNFHQPDNHDFNNARVLRELATHPHCSDCCFELSFPMQDESTFRLEYVQDFLVHEFEALGCHLAICFHADEGVLECFIQNSLHEEVNRVEMELDYHKKKVFIYPFGQRSQGKRPFLLVEGHQKGSF